MSAPAKPAASLPAPHLVPIALDTESVKRLRAGHKTVLRVPVDLDALTVIPRFTVRPDTFMGMPMSDDNICALGGQRHRAAMNQHGAVSAIINGKTLGLKPEEFDFVCPFAEGTTELGGSRGDWRRTWMIRPERSSLWVQETFYCDDAFAGDYEFYTRSVDQESSDAKQLEKQWLEDTCYLADGDPGFACEGADWQPAESMPIWASRLRLTVLSAQIEKLLDVTEEDAAREGACRSWLDENQHDVNVYGLPSHRQGFLLEWAAKYGQQAVKQNGWVWRFGLFIEGKP